MNVLLVLYSFEFTGFRVDVTSPPNNEHGLFAPVLASIIVIVIDFLGFSGSVTIIIVIAIVIEDFLALSYWKFLIAISNTNTNVKKTTTPKALGARCGKMNSYLSYEVRTLST